MVAMEPSSASSETPERKGGRLPPGRHPRNGHPREGRPGKGRPREGVPGQGDPGEGRQGAVHTEAGGTEAGRRPGRGGHRPGAPTGSRADGSHDESTGSVTGGVRYRGRGRNLALYSRAFQRNFEHWPLATRGVAALLRHPEPVLALLGAREPVERDGRVLNRNTQAMLELVRRFDVAGQGQSVDGETPDLPTRRRQLRLGARIAMPTRTDVHVSGRVVPGGGGSPPIPVRVYRQFGTGVGIGDPGRERPPAIAYFHGGGWVVGDLDTHDGTSVSWPPPAAAWSCPSTTGSRRNTPSRRPSTIASPPMPGCTPTAKSWDSHRARSASWATVPGGTWPPWWRSRPVTGRPRSPLPWRRASSTRPSMPCSAASRS